MKALAALLLTFAVAHAQVIENSVDFSISPAVVNDGDIQIAFEWLTPNDFRKTDLKIIDQVNVTGSHAGNNHIVASKLAFITKTSFDSLSYKKMNNSKYITDMLNSVAISSKTSDTWSVTNQVRAYSFPIRVSFDFKFREVSGDSLGDGLLSYIRGEGSVVKNPARERFLILDMTNFSQLMYRNYSIVYMKEVSPTQTLIVSGVVTGFDLNKANRYFNYPPFSTTKGTMMGNLKSQILHMAKSIQND